MFLFLADLCESKLIPSETSLKHWKSPKLAELCYLYFIGLRVLLANDKTKHWARKYCDHAGQPNDFEKWRTTGNDLYVMLYALHDNDKASISTSIIRHWLRHIATHDDEEDTRRLFTRLDSMFHITDSSMRSVRRIVTDWKDADTRERDDVLTKLVQWVHNRAPSNSEILPHLKKLKDLNEAASGGATGAGNVAAVVGGLGAGFDLDDEWRSVYPKKKQKPVILRRI